MNKQTTLLAASGALLSLAGAALAQAMSTEATPDLNSADQQYLTKNAQGSVADYTTAATALRKAQDKDVRGYAREVYNDHNKLDMQHLNRAQGLMNAMSASAGQCQ